MKLLNAVLFACIVSMVLFSCDSRYSTDPQMIDAGKALFDKHCSGCHGFGGDGIGPSLSGVTKKLSPEWLQRFIRDPKGVKDSATLMPSFSFLKDEEIASVTAYLNTHKDSPKVLNTDSNRLRDPIPAKIGSSGVVVSMIPICLFPASSREGELPLTRITKLSYAPGIKGVFVNDLRGVLYKIDRDKPVVYLNIAKQFPRFISEPGLATGFGSFAFHPDFIHNGLLYTSHAESANSGEPDFTFEDSIPHKLQWVLSEWKTDDPDADTFKGRNRELLRIDMVAEAHGMQEIAFRPTARKGMADFGLLYVAIGDGACVQLGYPFVVQGRECIWGSILRIDPSGSNSANKKYGIPESNPFYHDTSKKSVREVFVYGFRNPHRITWTPENDLLVSNIGQANIEAVYRVKPGDDCGWPVREGSFAFQPYGNLNNLYPLPENDSLNQYTYPILQYDHDEGKAVTGGYICNTGELPSLHGKLVFGDIPSGRLFKADLATKLIEEWNVSVNGKKTTLEELCGSDRVDLHFGMDESGAIYILTKADGKLYRLTSD